MSTATFIQYLVTAVGLVTFLAAAAVYLRGSADKGTITSLSNSIAALETAAKIKDTKMASQDAEIETLKARVGHLESENEVLRGTVTQKTEVATLTKMLDNHHSESMTALASLKEAVEHVR